MLASERKLKIIELLEQKHSVTVSELTRLFPVSLETIRRDLESLESEGLLKRVYGGAVSIKKMKNYEHLSRRSSENIEGKLELAQNAASMICSGDVIMLDTGTTAISLAKYISGRFKALTVITNSLSVFNILSGQPEYKLILTGGLYLSNEEAFYGHLAEDTLKQLHAGKCFLTPSAVSLNMGISDFVEELIPLQRKMLANADRAFILADSSKIGTDAIMQIAPLNASYTYITDSGLSTDIKEIYKQYNIEFIL